MLAISPVSLEGGSGSGSLTCTPPTRGLPDCRLSPTNERTDVSCVFSSLSTDRSLALAVVLLLFGLAADAPVTSAVGTATFTPDTAAAELTRLLAGERNPWPASSGAGSVSRSRRSRWSCALPGRTGGPGSSQGHGGERLLLSSVAAVPHLRHRRRLHDLGLPGLGWPAGGRGDRQTAATTSTRFLSVRLRCYAAELHRRHTSAPTTVAIAAYQLMTSQGHRDEVLSPAFTRIGCGAWSVPWAAFPGASTSVYACLFANGPGTASLPTPTSDSGPSPSPTPIHGANPHVARSNLDAGASRHASSHDYLAGSDHHAVSGQTHWRPRAPESQGLCRHGDALHPALRRRPPASSHLLCRRP